jgi:hypothetical protein
LRVLIRELDAMALPLTTEQRDAMAENCGRSPSCSRRAIWFSAMDRLQRAQDRLEEAIRNGASPEEIDQLMKDMQQAMRDYTQELGEEAQRNPEARRRGARARKSPATCCNRCWMRSSA